MTRTFCDKCGAELPDMKDIRLSWDGGVKQEKNGFMPRRAVYQLCGRCARAVDELINRKEAERK